MSIRKISLIWIFVLSAVFVIFQLIPENIKENNPSKTVTVIPLLPSVQEMVSVLDANEQIVAVSQHSVWPEQINNLPKVGGYQGINYEKIALIAPQYVIITEALKEATENLEKIGISYIELKDNTIEQIYNSILKLGTLLNREKKATAVVENLKKKLMELENKSKENQTKKVLVVVGFSGEIRNLYIAGKNNFLNEIIQKIGYENAYTGDLTYPSLSAEDILKINPDAVIILDERTEVTEEERDNVKKEWNKIDIKANKNGKVGIINGDYVFLPGPRFIQTAEDFAEFLAN